ncbi:hypothetical protein, partial [Mesorhizobium sp. M7A.T.Ca.US.000.02.2.1]|uniref:hypothetical protein n=1 Tax=Mesorhizobium sp. M7A.T.Ca.US.000.02.2.1 TaxID=2496793 RepID=UPI001AECD580
APPRPGLPITLRTRWGFVQSLFAAGEGTSSHPAALLMEAKTVAQALELHRHNQLKLAKLNPRLVYLGPPHLKG